jgi:hypothetical protein
MRGANARRISVRRAGKAVTWGERYPSPYVDRTTFVTYLVRREKEVIASNIIMMTVSMEANRASSLS